MFVKMYRSVKRTVALMALSTVAVAGAASAAPLTFVYEGAGCTGRPLVSHFETVLGHKVDGVSDFLDWTRDWPNVVTTAKWGVMCWKGSGYKLNLAVPLVVNWHSSTPLADTANGYADTYFKQIAQALVGGGFGDSYIRLGEELNYNFYPWAASASPKNFIAAYRRAQAAMKSVPGANFHFVWNPTLWTGNVAPNLAYPGDDVVDVIGTDVYDQSWDFNYTDPHVRWNDVQNLTWGLKDYVAFAQKHNKTYGFPEWGIGTRSDGHGGGDDPYFLTSFAPYLKGAEYASYWDYGAGDYHAQVSGGGQPGVMAAMIGEFGSAGAGSKSSVVEEQTIGHIMMAHASAYTPSTAPVVTCTGCSVAALQNGPGHWMLIVWSTAASPTAKVAWNVTPSNGNLYDPSVGTSPVRGLGQSTSINLALTANKPVIIALSV